MSEFKKYHPIVNFIYFAVILIFSMVFLHPFCLAVSLLSAFCYEVILNGKKAFKTNILLVLAVVMLSAIINPLFNHRGITILWYFPSGNPLTFETVVYGVASGTMLTSVILWFFCYNKIMTSDKFVYLFGKIIPSLSLVLSMTLRFVPKFKDRLKSVAEGQRCIGKKTNSLKSGMNILSVLVTWSLEDSIETADSMENRGYGLPGRTAFSIYIFTFRDGIALFLILLLSALTIVFHNSFKVTYYPVISFGKINIFAFFGYFVLCTLPIIIELWEGMKWKYLKSKI